MGDRLILSLMSLKIMDWNSFNFANWFDRVHIWEWLESFDFLIKNFFRIYFVAILHIFDRTFWIMGDRSILMSLKRIDCNWNFANWFDWIYIWEWLELFDFLTKNFFRIYFAVVLHIFDQTSNGGSIDFEFDEFENNGLKFV